MPDSSGRQTVLRQASKKRKTITPFGIGPAGIPT
jgi:hypothetical protein